MSLIAGFLVPVYSDEIGWRFQERAARDGVDILFSDLCGPNTLARPFWYMMPARWFSAISNQMLASPLFVRVEGVLCASGWAGLLWMLLAKLEPDRSRRQWIGMLSYLLLGLGSLPYILVLSRPEQPLILTTILILIVVFVRPPAITSRGETALKALAIICLSAVAQSYHLKGVPYAGIAFLAIAVCAQGGATLAPRLTGMGILALMTMTSAHYWADRLKCPGDAKLAAMYAGENLVAGLSGGVDSIGILGRALKGADPFNYVFLATPIPEPMSDWLPHGLFSPAVSVAFLFALMIFWGLALVATAFALGQFLLERRIRALADPRFVLAAALLGVFAIWGGSQLKRNVYEAGHMLPVLILAMVLSLTLPTARRTHLIGWLGHFGKIALPVSLIGQAIMIGTLAIPLWRTLSRPGYIQDQPFSVSISGYAGITSDIRRAMVGAGIPLRGPLYRPMIDDLTYLALQDSRLPLHRLGVLSTWNGRIQDPVAYLHDQRSDGVIVGCHFLSGDLREAATPSGVVCAVSRQTIDRLFRQRRQRADRKRRSARSTPNMALPPSTFELG
ncbi:hypothetical protein [Sphingomonas sp.]|uniref:hypothetical protein n=1 Tax=Sphingomonas sp. TaxID=28214 RepID=UPI0025FC1F34|nr:hypothetical protein [Sphingomonas sp.]